MSLFRYPETEITRRLAAKGLRDVADWCTWPTQVTGRIPPDMHWFYYRERSGHASIEIFPPGRYPFASPESGANAGWDAHALGKEPPVEWEHWCETPPSPSDEAELTEELVFRFLDLWRAGEPSGC